MRIIAFIVDHGVIGKILRHLRRKQVERERGSPEPSRPEAAS